MVPSLSQVMSGRGLPEAAHSRVAWPPTGVAAWRGAARNVGASGRLPPSSSDSTASLASADSRYLSPLDTLQR